MTDALLGMLGTCIWKRIEISGYFGNQLQETKEKDVDALNLYLYSFYDIIE